MFHATLNRITAINSTDHVQYERVSLQPLHVFVCKDEAKQLSTLSYMNMSFNGSVKRNRSPLVYAIVLKKHVGGTRITVSLST